MTAIEAIEDDSVIVFIDGSNLHHTPEQVQNSYARAAGSPLPILVFYDPKIEKELGFVGYREIRTRDGFKDVKAEIAKLLGKVPEADKQTSS